MTRATICIHCGQIIKPPNDPKEVMRIHKIMLAHEMECAKNPLVIKRLELESYLEEINNIMWKSFHIKDNGFTRVEGVKINNVLIKWALNKSSEE